MQSELTLCHQHSLAVRYIGEFCSSGLLLSKRTQLHGTRPTAQPLLEEDRSKCARAPCTWNTRRQSNNSYETQQHNNACKSSRNSPLVSDWDISRHEAIDQRNRRAGFLKSALRGDTRE